MHYEIQHFRNTNFAFDIMFFSDYFTDVSKALKQFSDEMLKAANDNDDDSIRVSEIKLMRIVGDDIHPVATWKRH